MMTMIKSTRKRQIDRNLIEKIFERFRQETDQFPREYFHRFTQLFVQNIDIDRDFVQLIESHCFPLDPTNEVKFEYQLRLIRFSLQEKIFSIDENILRTLFQHRLMKTSSLFRHLTLEIGLLVERIDFDDEFYREILEIFSSDENLYVRRSFALFCSICLPKKFDVDLVRQAPKNDLIYEILLHRSIDEQMKTFDEFRLIETLTIETPTIRRFMLQIGGILVDEQALIIYLNRLVKISVDDYIHCLFTLILKRVEHQRSIVRLTECLHAVFLFMQDEEIEEFSSTTPIEFDSNFSSIISHCEVFFELEIEPNEFASIVFKSLDEKLRKICSKFDFYSSTIFYLLTKRKICDEKFYSNLLRCVEDLKISSDFIERIRNEIEEKFRSSCVYQSFFDLIIKRPEGNVHLERLHPLINVLLSTSSDHLHWDHLDCLLTFLIDLIKVKPNWFDATFVDEIINKLIDHPNEFIQTNLIRFISQLIQNETFSSSNEKFIEHLIHFAEYSLGDVARCALAEAWNVVLSKCSDEKKLKKVVRQQIRRLIGDAGEQTELRCLKLLERIGFDVNEDEDLIRYFLHDGATKTIQSEARRIFSSEDQINNDDQHSDEILQEEFRSILHWFDHPDEHLVLDCD